VSLSHRSASSSNVRRSDDADEATTTRRDRSNQRWRSAGSTSSSAGSTSSTAHSREGTNDTRHCSCVNRGLPFVRSSVCIALHRVDDSQSTRLREPPEALYFLDRAVKTCLELS